MAPHWQQFLVCILFGCARCNREQVPIVLAVVIHNQSEERRRKERNVCRERWWMWPLLQKTLEVSFSHLHPCVDHPWRAADFSQPSALVRSLKKIIIIMGKGQEVLPVYNFLSTPCSVVIQALLITHSPHFGHISAVFWCPAKPQRQLEWTQTPPVELVSGEGGTRGRKSARVVWLFDTAVKKGSVLAPVPNSASGFIQWLTHAKFMSS